MDTGYTQKQIAEYYQCSVDTIQRRIKQYGIKPQNTASNYNENENENEKEKTKGDGKVYVYESNKPRACFWLSE